MILYIWLGYIVLVCLEIARNYRIIEEKKQRPIYLRRWFIRVAVSLVYWIPFYWVLPYYQWLGMLVMMPLTFWFVFDYGLNAARRKPFAYLNPNGSWLDRLQVNSTGVAAWFFWKLILMAAGVWLFYKGVDVIWLIPN